MNGLKSVKEKMIKNTKFILRPCLEFVSALRVISDENNLRVIAKEMNFQISTEDNGLMNALKEKVSKYVLSEFQYFSDMVPVYIYSAAFAADNEDIQTVEELLKTMDNAEIELVFKYLGGIFIGEYVKGLHDEWAKIDNDIQKMEKYIRDADIEEKERKEKFLECIQNPEETKQRLCYMFRQFYEKAYINIEHDLLGALEIEREKYLTLFNENPEAFFSKYLNNFFKSTNGEWDFKMNIQVSILFQITFWILNLHDYIEKRGIVVLGARMDNFVNAQAVKDQVDKFLKVLSDKRRVDIIKLLAEKTYYGYEFASILKLTPATVNYHMSFIIDAGLVSFEREDNKVLFNLDKEKIKMLFKETEKMLLNDF